MIETTAPALKAASENTAVWRAPLKRVVLATDFSREAERAAARALQLPLAPDATVLIVHVFPPAAPNAFGAQGVEARARTALAKFEAKLRKRARDAGREDLEFRAEWVVGHVDEELPRLARAERIDLIVLGRHGFRTFKDQVLGTTAERIIRVSPVPALVVSNRIARPYRRPLVALEPDEAVRPALEWAMRLSPQAKKVGLVHAYDHSYELVLNQTNASPKKVLAYRRGRLDAAQARCRGFLQRYADDAPQMDLMLHGGDPRNAILDVIKEEKVDLVALGTHARRGLAHLLLGSVAETVMRRATCDVLIARAPSS